MFVHSFLFFNSNIIHLVVTVDYSHLYENTMMVFQKQVKEQVRVLFIEWSVLFLSSDFLHFSHFGLKVLRGRHCYTLSFVFQEMSLSNWPNIWDITMLYKWRSKHYKGCLTWSFSYFFLSSVKVGLGLPRTPFTVIILLLMFILYIKM